MKITFEVVPLYFFLYILFIYEREREREREREAEGGSKGGREQGREGEKHRSVAPLINAFIGCFLHVPCLGKTPAVLAWGQRSTSWATRPGLLYIFLNVVFYP